MVSLMDLLVKTVNEALDKPWSVSERLYGREVTMASTSSLSVLQKLRLLYCDAGWKCYLMRQGARIYFHFQS